MIDLMDFITILVFMLVMAAVFYQRVTDNIQKKAAKKNSLSASDLSACSGKAVCANRRGIFCTIIHICGRRAEKYFCTEKKERKKRNEMPAERKEQGKEDGNEIHPLPSLKMLPKRAARLSIPKYSIANMIEDPLPE